MAETVGVKLATPADAGAILALLKQLSKESEAILVPFLDRLTVEQEARTLQEIGESADALILLAELEGQLIGIVTIMCLADEPNVGELGVAVLKEYWHHGIGSLLVDEAVYWYANYSTLDRLVLDVFKDNQAAIVLYEKYGFVKTGETKVKDCHDQMRPAWLMEFKFADEQN